MGAVNLSKANFLFFFFCSCALIKVSIGGDVCACLVFCFPPLPGVSESARIQMLVGAQRSSQDSEGSLQPEKHKAATR